MRASLKNKIAPPVPKQNKDYNQAKIQHVTKKTETNPIDFKELLLRSSRDIKQKRQAESNGDLSGAKNYEDFLESLNRQTKQEDLPKNTLDKNDFLNLFITQLQNQDPLNPKDGTEMASQLAQFNSLEQMMNINTALEQLGSKTEQGHSIQYVNYIGKEVAINNGKIRLDNGSLSDASFKTDIPTNRTTMTVRDSLGNIVASKELGAKEAGEHKLDWDGRNKEGEKVPDGIYTFSLSGKGKGKAEIDIPVTTRVRITGIDMKGQGSSFHTNLGKIDYTDIAEIGEQLAPVNTKEPNKKSIPINNEPGKANTDKKGIKENSQATAAPKKPTESPQKEPQELAQNFYPEIRQPFTALEAYRSNNSPREEKLPTQ
ncbi:MAG: flagellar hook assembly protein FlgD [Oligoflexales bacterium]|nr:flagellar hook assembly protein FlgD [Oligoflexales bacterium]